MGSVRRWGLVGIAFLIAKIALAQTLDARHICQVDLPHNSPITLVSANWVQCQSMVRGSALIDDLRVVLTLRNTSPQRIRGVALSVAASAATPNATRLWMPPALNIAHGETFPIRIDLRLLGPVQESAARAVLVSLDGVLFDNLQFNGPDRMGSRRLLESREYEAQSDRQFFKSLLESAGADGLRRRMLASLGRLSPDTRIGQPAVCGRATIFEPVAQALQALSPEEERLGDVYRKKGMKALIEELGTF